MNNDKKHSNHDVLIISAIVTTVISAAVGATWIAVEVLKALGLL